MPKNKEIHKKISPKKYGEILSGVELEGITMIRGRFSLNKEELSPEAEYAIKNTASYEISKENVAIVSHSYRLGVINKESRKKALHIECTYHVDYSSETDFTEEFFELFREVNLPLNTWPFFREYVFNITSRMNIPPLSLPLLKRFV